jgi:hypothetical protein
MKNLLSSFARTKIVGLALALALPVMAHADGVKGKFTLTSEAHWGRAVLAPGSYDFTLDSTSVPSRVMVHSADGKVAAILIPMCGTEGYPVKSTSLELETRGGDLYVSGLYLADSDMELHFAIPAVKQSTMATTTAKPAATIAAAIQ